MLGSSNIYNDPTKLLPNEVAKFKRCDSPPESVFDGRLSDRYPRPTSHINCKRLVISNNKRFAISLSLLSSLPGRALKKSYASHTDISTRSDIDLSLIFT